MYRYATTSRAIGRWSMSEIDPWRAQNTWPIGDFWSPLQAAGCYLWLDFSDERQTTIQSPHFTAIQDKSNNNRGASTIFNQRPIYEFNHQTQQNHALFANNYIAEGSLGNLTLTQSDIYIVMRMDHSSGQNARVYTHSDSGFDYNTSGHYIPLIKAGAANSLGAYVNGGNAAAVPFNNGEVFIFNARHSGSLITNIKNGQTSATADHTLNKTFTRYRLGAHFDNNTGTFNGWIGEIICYSSLLSALDQDRVVGYLAWKWSLLSVLATSHPYKLIWPRQ